MIKIENTVYPNAQLIGLCSTTGAGSGKTYAANLIGELHPDLTYRVMSFATPLKELCDHIVCDMWGFNKPGETSSSPLGNKCARPFPLKSDFLPGTDKRLRDLYISVGTGFYRQRDPEYWVARTQDDVKTALEADPDQLIIVDDIRFANEFDWIVASGGWCFNVIRPSIKDYVSDCGDDFALFLGEHHTLTNDGTRLGLTAEVRKKVLSAGRG